MTGRRAILSGRVSVLVAAAGIAFLLVLLGIAQRTTSPLWFLLFPVLLLGVLLAAAAAVLRMLRHF
jgi:NAD(P)-dependent dehydrogenase (short-subunit alcohol dehydrogenase family)